MFGDEFEQEILQSVSNLNQEIFEKLDNKFDDIHFFHLEYRTDTFCSIVIFLGIPLWNSDDDEREYIDEETELKETFEAYFRRKINTIIDNLKLIAF